MQDAATTEWVPLSVVAKELGIGHETARQLAVNGDIEACKPTGNPRGWWKASRASVDRHKAKVAAQSPQPA